ncbi:D-xylose 1-dehydrogenase Gfo6 [Halosolutus halophilus]|uniref:D-xylose 1-dehydrogenase Gfo6 n=1 Tax=Halosolutus halophilus TaxID=1552990 RepID=UPI002235167C|nr:D-xylose 1-dehydrogenase Gfo6 [Halosolutus halophilus]
MELESVLDSGCSRDWQSVAPEAVDPLRFAVVGIGWFTRERALPALVESELCEPTVTVSSTTEKAERVAETVDRAERGISYEQFHDGVAADRYDAVYICTPNALHLPYARTAAQYGKAVLCEKPMERDTERSRELIDVCDEQNVPLMIAYRMHTEPAVRRAREIVDAELIGEPVEVYGSMSQRLLDRINPDPDQWRLDEELAGGGALFDIGLYPLNTTRFILGDDPIAVTGRTRSTHDAFDDVDETVSCTIEFPDEVFATCTASHNARQSSTLRITGTEGQVAIEPAFFQDQQRSLHVSRGDGRLSVALEKVDQMLEEFDYFADRVRSDAPILPDGEHGVVDVEAMQAVYRSAERREWITL